MTKWIISLALFFLLCLPCKAGPYLHYNIGAFRSICYELQENGAYNGWMNALLHQMRGDRDDEEGLFDQKCFEAVIEHWRIWRLQKVLLNLFIQLR